MRFYDWRLLFEPTTLRQKVVKWLAILVVNVIGVFFLVSTIQDISYYQRVCREGVWVDAVISVLPGDIWNRKADYESWLSYEYDGIRYEDVFYDGGRSPERMKDNGKTIRVLIDPQNPTQLAERIVNIFLVAVSLIVFSVGIAMLLYGIAIEVPGFYQKCLALQQRKYPHLTSLDHWPDVGLMAGILFIVLWITLILIFRDVIGFNVAMKL
jgi:hypothetical protein